ncbi:hypothetical protein QOT17_002298 [Balamuthia mandrillaris]
MVAWVQGNKIVLHITPTGVGDNVCPGPDGLPATPILIFRVLLDAQTPALINSVGGYNRYNDEEWLEQNANQWVERHSFLGSGRDYLLAYFQHARTHQGASSPLSLLALNKLARMNQESLRTTSEEHEDWKKAMQTNIFDLDFFRCVQCESHFVEFKPPPPDGKEEEEERGGKEKEGQEHSYWDEGEVGDHRILLGRPEHVLPTTRKLVTIPRVQRMPPNGLLGLFEEVMRRRIDYLDGHNIYQSNNPPLLFSSWLMKNWMLSKFPVRKEGFDQHFRQMLQQLNEQGELIITILPRAVLFEALPCEEGDLSAKEEFLAALNRFLESFVNNPQWGMAYFPENLNIWQTNAVEQALEQLGIGKTAMRSGLRAHKEGITLHDITSTPTSIPSKKRKRKSGDEEEEEETEEEEKEKEKEQQTDEGLNDFIFMVSYLKPPARPAVGDSPYDWPRCYRFVGEVILDCVQKRCCSASCALAHVQQSSEKELFDGREAVFSWSEAIFEIEVTDAKHLQGFHTGMTYYSWAW